MKVKRITISNTEMVLFFSTEARSTWDNLVEETSMDKELCTNQMDRYSIKANGGEASHMIPDLIYMLSLTK